MTPRNLDVLVVGGGVIGLSCAWRLAQSELKVALYDKGQLGSESSAAALGVLSPQAEESRPQALVDLQCTSLGLYPALAEELQTITDVDIEFGGEGMIYASSEAGALDKEIATQHAAGVPVDTLTRKAAVELEPALKDAVFSEALLFRAARRVNNQQLCQALALAATKEKVELYPGAPVTELLRKGERTVGAVVNGKSVSAEWIVLAAGSWSGEVAGLRLPVRPAKGQALALEAPFRLRHAIDCEAGYIVPRANSELLIGATVEDAGYDTRPTAAGIGDLLAGITHFLPTLRGASVLRTWAGLRPRSADDLPILGPMNGAQGLIIASGHFRNGILLAPITAQLVKDWVSGAKTDSDLHLFSPDRFGEAAIRH